jgi:hypothetical protein
MIVTELTQCIFEASVVAYVIGLSAILYLAVWPKKQYVVPKVRRPSWRRPRTACRRRYDE